MEQPHHHFQERMIWVSRRFRGNPESWNAGETLHRPMAAAAASTADSRFAQPDIKYKVHPNSGLIERAGTSGK
jgi:hypothetical protein